MKQALIILLFLATACTAGQHATGIYSREYCSFWFSTSQAEQLRKANTRSFFHRPGEEAPPRFPVNLVNGKVYTECSCDSRAPAGAWRDYELVYRGRRHHVTQKGTW